MSAWNLSVSVFRIVTLFSSVHRQCHFGGTFNRHIPPWRWRQWVPQECWYQPNYGATHSRRHLDPGVHFGTNVSDEHYLYPGDRGGMLLRNVCPTKLHDINQALITASDAISHAWKFSLSVYAVSLMDLLSSEIHSADGRQLLWGEVAV